MTINALIPQKIWYYDNTPLRIYHWGTNIYYPIRDLAVSMGYKPGASGSWGRWVPGKCKIKKWVASTSSETDVTFHEWDLVDAVGATIICERKYKYYFEKYCQYFNSDTGKPNHPELTSEMEADKLFRNEIENLLKYVKVAKSLLAFFHGQSPDASTFQEFKSELNLPKNSGALKRIKKRNIAQKLEDLSKQEASGLTEIPPKSPVTALFIDLAVGILKQVRALANEFDVDLTTEELVDYKFTVENDPSNYRPPADEHKYKEDD